MPSAPQWRRGPRAHLVMASCLLIVLAVAAFVRFDGLGAPGTYVGDEGFYAPDACVYVLDKPATCHRTTEATPEHPPLGKWLIGVGILADGYHPAGWRLASALAGTSTVGLLFVLVLVLLGSTSIATLSAALLALEPLHIVQSRIATLDVFVAMFGVAAVLFADLDKRSTTPRFLPGWRLLAGVAGGAAVASKWSGVLALAVAAGLTLLTKRESLARTVASSFVAFVLAPFLVYAATYAGRIHGSVLATPWSRQSIVREFVHRTHMMWRDQTGAFHPSTYQSPPWSWPLLRRPVVHYVQVSHGQIREILAVGSPIVWWLGFAAFAWATVVAVHSRGRDRASLVVALSVGLTYLPWLLFAHGRSFVFIYYMTPIVPFLCLAMGWAAFQLPGRLRLALPGAVVASVLLLVFWWPILTENPVSFGAWRDRVVFHDCRAADQPARLPMDSHGVPRAWLKLLHGEPQGGWCWV
jgi:dolichyl-phosphate-mannose-protein mannosyltransferase